MGGATLEEPVKEGQGPKSNGSAMILCADTEEEAMKIIKSDVYTENKVWDLSKVRNRFPFDCMCPRGAERYMQKLLSNYHSALHVP